MSAADARSAKLANVEADARVLVGIFASLVGPVGSVPNHWSWSRPSGRFWTEHRFARDGCAPRQFCRRPDA
jgi:hypothetical protein